MNFKLSTKKYYLVMAAITSVINGMLLYALSMELSSNLYYSTTQYATLYTTCISFLGHGLGGVLYSKIDSLSENSIKKTLKIWVIAIILSFLAVFLIYPPLMKGIYSLTISYHSSVFFSNISWLKILLAGTVEMPAFLAGGMVYASIVGYVRQFHENITPYVTAASTFGTAIGYLVGLLIIDFPGINATFILALVILFLLIWNPRLYIGLPILIVFLIFSHIVDIDNWVEQIRSKDNNVYAKMVGGTVIDYDWSRFQKSEYVISGGGIMKKFM